jgi:excisionase family DNA binding protein
MVYSIIYMAIEFMTPQEVADLLKLNVMTIYEYIRIGALKAIKFGRSYRVRIKDFERFIESRRVN